MFRFIPQLDATITVGMYMLTFMKAVIYLSKYVFPIVYHFLLVGNGDTIMSRLSVVTWTRHFLPSPLPSIACLALMVMFCI